jgi:hypothetical protein
MQKRIESEAQQIRNSANCRALRLYSTIGKTQGSSTVAACYGLQNKTESDFASSTMFTSEQPFSSRAKPNVTVLRMSRDEHSQSQLATATYVTIVKEMDPLGCRRFGGGG